MTFLPSTGISRQAVFAHLLPRRLSERLGNRLVFHILFISALLSLLTSSFQLFFGYQRDRHDLSGLSASIDQSLHSGFRDALWEYNFPLVEALLDGVFSEADVVFVRLTTPQGREWTLGTSKPDLIYSEILYEYPAQDGKDVVVGTKVVGVSTKSAMDSLIAQIWIVLLTNFAKALVGSIAISILFEHQVGRHLRRVAEHVSKSNWQDVSDKMNFDRGRRPYPDDLDHIVHAIRSAKQRGQADFALLETEVARRRQSELELMQKTAALENVNREQGEFSYAISHDMKSPANTIKMLISELSLIGDSCMDDECKEIVGDIDQTAGRMTQLIDDMLRYAQTVGAEIERESVDMNLLLKEICADLKGEIRQTNAQINVAQLPTLYGCPGQLRILFQNLLSNAVKFRSPDRIPQIDIGCRIEGPVLRFFVRDNGIGVPRQHHDNIFGMFKRLHSHGTYDGSGLGLALCKRIATNHFADIKVSVGHDHGSEFSVSFRKDAHADEN